MINRNNNKQQMEFYQVCNLKSQLYLPVKSTETKGMFVVDRIQTCTFLFIIGSQAGVQITQASNTSTNKASNTDSKQQTIQSSSATTANCSVAKLSSSLDSQAHSTANHNQLSGTN